MSSLKTRTTLYSVTLSLGICEPAVAFSYGVLDGFARLQSAFGSLTGGLAVVSWIWISILLSYNNRPTSTNVLSKAFVHFSSFILLVVIYVVCGILLSTLLPANCDLSRPSDGQVFIWCGVGSTATGLAFLLAILSGVSAFVVRQATPDLSNNVCAGDRTPGSFVLNEAT